MALAVVSEDEMARARHAVVAPDWPDLDRQDWDGPDWDGRDFDRSAHPGSRDGAEATPRLRLVLGHVPAGPMAEEADEASPIVLLPVRHQDAPRRHVSARVRRRRLLAAGIAVGAAVLTVVPMTGLLGQAQGAQPLVQAAEANLPVQSQAGQGTFYVVQPGDTVSSIARRIEPSDPGQARADLLRLLGSDTVVPGEHVRLS